MQAAAEMKAVRKMVPRRPSQLFLSAQSISENAHITCEVCLQRSGEPATEDSAAEVGSAVNETANGGQLVELSDDPGLSWPPATHPRIHSS